MEQKMTWAEIKKNFPNEWVALANYKQTSAIGVAGSVIAHNPNKKAFHEKIRELMPKYHNIAVRYTGKLIKNPEIPLRWQIFPCRVVGVDPEKQVITTHAEE